MNKHKKDDRGLGLLEMTILCVAGVILMTAGVGHAWLRNSQVEAVREMDSSQRRIQDHEDVINSLQVKIDKKLNIYQLRDDLEKADSRLVQVPVSALERIPSHPVQSGVGSVATTSNHDPTLAQSSP